MKKHALAAITIVSLAAVLAGSESCGGANRGPTAPPPISSGSAHTISGTITEYDGGPVDGAYVAPSSSCNICETFTDAQGHFSINMSSVEPTALSAGKVGYQTAWKFQMSAQNPNADFALHRALTANAFGGTVADTVAGDEFIGLDDLSFGGVCAHTACRVIEFDTFLGSPRQVQITLRWPDATHQLALYKAQGDSGSYVPPLYYSGPSGLTATVSVSGYFDAIAVA